MNLRAPTSMVLLLIAGCFDPAKVDLTGTTGDADDDGGSGTGDATDPSADGGPGDPTDDPSDPTSDPTVDPDDTTGEPPTACVSDDDCSDADPCVVGTCNAQGQCEQTVVDPDDDDACTDDSCDPVTHAPINTPTDLDDGDACTFDACDPVTGPSHIGEVVLFEETFTAGAGSWVANSPWQIGPAVPSGASLSIPGYLTDPAEDHSATNDNMLAGIAIGGFTPVIVGAPHLLESPTIDAEVGQGSVVLEYWRWLVTDYAPYMVNTVEVYTAGGTWQVVWQSGDISVMDTGWHFVSHDITDYAHENLRVRFGLTIGQTGAYEDAPSWSIDDVRIVNVAAHNDDGNLCTMDTCDPAAGAVNVPVALDDANGCTIDECDPALGVTHRDNSLRLVQDFSAPSVSGWWTLGPEWQIGPAVAGSTDPGTDSTPSPDNRLAGVNLGGDYQATLHAPYYLESPWFDGSGSSNLALNFQRWLYTDYPPYVNSTVEVYNGASWITVWGDPGGVYDNAWVPQSFDITPYASPSMRVRFGFGTAAGLYTYGGWNVDDVRVIDQSCN